MQASPMQLGPVLRTRPLAVMLVCSLTACDSSGRRTAQEFRAPDSTVSSLRADALRWTSPSLAGFPPGVRIAVLEGDPDGRGTYTLRASFPDGYRFPAHRHSEDQRITVISGTFLFAEGERFDFVRLRAHEPGDFLIASAGGAHYGGAEGQTVVQFHGFGPFEPTLVDPYLPGPERAGITSSDTHHEKGA